MAESSKGKKAYPFWQWKKHGQRKKSKKDISMSYTEAFSPMQEDINVDRTWKEPLKDEVELSPQQECVLNLVREGKNVFYTGNAGTGKTTLLGKIRQCAPEDTYVTALTGVAAVQAGGTTLHSFAGIGLGNGSKESLLEIVCKGRKVKNWKKVKVLIIDEVSMLDGKLFDKLEYIARKVRGNELPFGGIQLVVCGDFFQLPPIQKVGETSVNFCFQSAAWSKCIKYSLELTQIYRQSDPKLIKLLNEVRYQYVSEESLELLQYLNRPIQEIGDIEPTKLYSHNARVNDINNAKLSCLPGEEMVYTAEDHGRSPYVENMGKYVIAMDRLVLKVGAQVMLLKNLTEELINGSRGVVEEFDQDGWPCVKFVHGGMRTIKEEDWNLENSSGSVLAVRTQIPLKLAWAITIHKSQGMSIDFLQVDLKNVFSQGQAYVALSRARTLEGLQVLSFDATKFTTSDAVIKFYQDKVKEAPSTSDCRLTIDKRPACRSLLSPSIKRQRTANNDETLCSTTKSHFPPECCTKELVDNKMESPLGKHPVKIPRTTGKNMKQDITMQQGGGPVPLQTSSVNEHKGFQTALSLYKQSSTGELSSQGKQSHVSLNSQSQSSIGSNRGTRGEGTGEICGDEFLEERGSECLTASQGKQDESELMLLSEEGSKCFQRSDTSSNSYSVLLTGNKSGCFWDLNEDQFDEEGSISGQGKTPLVVKRRLSTTPSSKVRDCQPHTANPTNSLLCKYPEMTHSKKKDISREHKTNNQEANTSILVESRKYEHLRQKSKKNCSILFEKLKNETARTELLDNDIDTDKEDNGSCSQLDVDCCKVVDEPLMRPSSDPEVKSSASEESLQSISIEKAKQRSKLKCSFLFDSLKEDTSVLTYGEDNEGLSPDDKICNYSSQLQLCGPEIRHESQVNSVAKPPQKPNTTNRKLQPVNGVMTTDVCTQTESLTLDYYLGNVPLVMTGPLLKTFGLMFVLAAILYQNITHMYCEQYHLYYRQD